MLKKFGSRLRRKAGAAQEDIEARIGAERIELWVDGDIGEAMRFRPYLIGFF